MEKIQRFPRLTLPSVVQDPETRQTEPLRTQSVTRNAHSPNYLNSRVDSLVDVAAVHKQALKALKGTLPLPLVIKRKKPRPRLQPIHTLGESRDRLVTLPSKTRLL